MDSVLQALVSEYAVRTLQKKLKLGFDGGDAGSSAYQAVVARVVGFDEGLLYLEKRK
jgi:hypothetical protein